MAVARELPGSINLSAFAFDLCSGWGGVVQIITPDEIITKKLKGRKALTESYRSQYFALPQENKPKSRDTSSDKSSECCSTSLPGLFRHWKNLLETSGNRFEPLISALLRYGLALQREGHRGPNMRSLLTRLKLEPQFRKNRCEIGCYPTFQWSVYNIYIYIFDMYMDMM